MSRFCSGVRNGACSIRAMPESALTQWYNDRFGSGSSRIRRIGIVALARRLLIDLWRYLDTGVLPDGAWTKSEFASSHAAVTT